MILITIHIITCFICTCGFTLKRSTCMTKDIPQKKGSIGVGRKGERESVKSVRFWVEIFTRSQPTKLWSFKISYAVISK